MISDIAAIYHWPLSDIVELSFEELIAWRGRAIKSWNQMHGDPKK